MCIICKLWAQEIITIKEAKRACFELVETVDVDEKHLQELYAKLRDEEKKKDEENAKN